LLLRGRDFVPMAGALGAQQVGAHVSRRVVQPPFEQRSAADRAGLSGEDDEDDLGGVFGQVQVAELAATGRIDERKMTADELSERGAGSLCHVLLKQFQIIACHCLIMSAASENGTRGV
jgi:hypothetical protein